MKIGPVDPEILVSKDSLKIRKKLTQAKHIACSASMPNGLNEDRFSKFFHFHIPKETLFAYILEL